MIVQKDIIQINPGIKYLSDFTDPATGMSIIDWLLRQGRIIVNKDVTGCGFTSGCLANRDNVILTSPRIQLLRNKRRHFNKVDPEKNPRGEELLFYFDRDKNLDTLKLALWGYFQDSDRGARPYKILVTYDSLIALLDMLESEFGFNIGEQFRIVVDESHCIIKDIKLKEYHNKNTMSMFLSRVFCYDSVLFVSATPIVKYLQAIPKFQEYEVGYYELAWATKEKVLDRYFPCSCAADAFKKIYKAYERQVDPSGKHYFDIIYNNDGSYECSYEAVVFINSVSDIGTILKTWMKRKRRIKVEDVSVMCADTYDNKKELRQIDPGLTIMTDIPEEGEPHTTWTFCTRTCFAGVDFYSPSASTYVVANYNVESLSLDVASDIPQIIGRQRLPENHFRNRISIFYTNNTKVVDDVKFQEMRKRKYDESMKQIVLWQGSSADLKDLALNNLKTVIEGNPNDYYLSTVNGYPEINPLLMADEQYCRDILTNQITWFVLSGQGNTQGGYSLPVQTLKDELSQLQYIQDRLRKVYEYALKYPMVRDELNLMLWSEGYNDIAHYINSLPLDRLYACGFNTTKMDQEIKAIQEGPHIEPIIYARFQVDQKYTREEIKIALGEIYTAAGLKKTPKATDLEDYFTCVDCKKVGQRAYLLKAKN